MRALVIPFGSLRSRVHGYGRQLVFPLADQAMSLEVHVGVLRWNRAPCRRSSRGLRLGLLTRHFSVPSPASPRMSKIRWVASILERLSFFLEWHFPDSGVALMGVLVSGGLTSGFPSSARLTVGTYGGNKAHLEPTGGIPSGRPAERIP